MSSTHPTSHSAGFTAADAATVIGRGIRVEGRISGSEDLYVEGHVEGAIDLTDVLYVAPEGVVAAQIEARDVVVSGVVVGNVTATASVTLHAGAKLVGDITAERLVIADGAAFSGSVSMSDASSSSRPAATTRARPSATASSHRTASPARSRGTRPRASEATAPQAATPPLKRVAAIPPPELPHAEEESTVVVRHAAIDGKSGAQESGSAKETSSRGRTGAKKKAKKSPPRARVPKPGKRRVARRNS